MATLTAKVTDEVAAAFSKYAKDCGSTVNAQLRELAKKNPPLPKWFDEEEEAPF